LLRRIVSGIILTLLLISVLAAVFSVSNVQPSKAKETVSIEPDSPGILWVAATEWNKTYGGTGNDYAWSMVQTSDGGYAIAGYTRSYGAGLKDFWLVKTDSSGNNQWSRTYGGTNDDEARSVVQTSDGGYAMAGITTSYGWYDFWLVKTNSLGNMTWSRTYGGADTDDARSVVQTSDGGYAMAGITTSYGAGWYDFWLVKTNSLGNMTWSRTYGGIGNDNAWSMVQTSDGGYAIAGLTTSYGVGGYDFWLVKTDSSGNEQWNRTYGGTNDDVAYSVVQTSDGGYALGGYTRSYGAGPQDMWLVKTDSLGDAEWNKTYGGANPETAWSLVQTSDGGYALGGLTFSFGAGSSDFWLVRTDSSGNKRWDKTYGGTSNDEAHSVVQTSDGGYALAGPTASYGAGNWDFWLVKTTPTPIYIRADGSVDPATAPIQRNGDLYTLTDNVFSDTHGIVIQRNNMTLNGAGHSVQGPEAGYGLILASISNVTIRNMTVKSFYYGVVGNATQNSVFSGNNITNNSYGIRLDWSSNNSFYHNNIIDNVVIVYLYNSANVWDDGYPSGGNYWRLGNATDLFRGAYQNITGSDGIDDQPFILNGSNRDRYPLMGPFGPSTMIGENITVFPTDDVGLIFENVTGEGSTTVTRSGSGPAPPSGFELAGQYYDIQTTATYSGGITIRIIYDDSGMTLWVEANLRLRQWNGTSLQWEDITSRVDTENNVIYGDAPHLSIFGTTGIVPLAADVAVVSATVLKTVVCQGYKANISVALRNQGSSILTFDFFVYANSTVIDSRTVSNLAPSEQRTFDFVWQVAPDFPKGDYTVLVGDNLISWIKVAMAGSVNGDIKVDGKDIALAARAFGKNLGQIGYVPNADINNDGKNDGKDIALIAREFGKIDP